MVFMQSQLAGFFQCCAYWKAGTQITTVVCMIFEMISWIPFKRSQLCHPSLFSVTFHAICSSVPQSLAHTGPLTLQPSSLRRRHRVGLHLRQERPHGHLTFSLLMSYHIKKNQLQTCIYNQQRRKDCGYTDQQPFAVSVSALIKVEKHRSLNFLDPTVTFPALYSETKLWLQSCRLIWFMDAAGQHLSNASFTQLLLKRWWNVVGFCYTVWFGTITGAKVKAC